MTDPLTRLEAVVAARRAAPADASYVASLHARGLPRIAQKLGEEATETIVAALTGDADALTGEAADLLFHLIVLLDARGVAVARVLAELDARAGVSGLAEKAARASAPAPAPSPVSSSALASGPRPTARPRIRKG